VTGTDDQQPPMLRVVHGGEPTSEEIAALVVALESRRASPTGPAQRSAWSDRAGSLRRPLARGADAWRTSGRVPGVRTRAGT
jgi:hypothetical protein